MDIRRDLLEPRTKIGLDLLGVISLEDIIEQLIGTTYEFTYSSLINHIAMNTARKGEEILDETDVHIKPVKILNQHASSDLGNDREAFQYSAHTATTKSASDSTLGSATLNQISEQRESDDSSKNQESKPLLQ